MDSKDIIEDDIYQSLRNTFLASGRGRRPNLPVIVLNQKLLVQLHYLKHESQCKKSWSEIEDCLLRIFPEAATHRSRIRHSIETAYQQFRSNPHNVAFLESGVDFDFLSEKLSAFGITRASIGYPPTTSLMSNSIDNSVLIDIENARASMNLPHMIPSKWISYLTGFPHCSKLVCIVKKTLKKYSRLRANKSKCPERLQEFLSSAFTSSPLVSPLPNVSPTRTSFETEAPVQSAETTHTRQSSSPLHSVQQSSPVPQHTDHSRPSSPSPSVRLTSPVLPKPSCPSPSTPVQRRTDFNNSLVKSLNEKLITLESSLAEVQRDKFSLLQEVSILKEQLSRVEKTHDLQVASLKQKFESIVNKKDVMITKKDLMISELKSAHDKACDKLNSVISQLRKDLCEQCAITNKRELAVAKLISSNKFLKHELHKLVLKNADLEDNPFDVQLKNSKNNEYTDDVRKAVISLVCETGVSAKNVRNVLKIVASNIFNTEFSERLPCAQTVLNMCDEAFVLSNMQVVESVLNSDNVTLHFDGTSRDQKKIVGHQFTLDSGKTLYLGFVPVATENAETLLDIAVIVLEKLVNCYKDLTSISSDVIFKEIFSKITSVMSDRAAPNILFSKKFTDKVQAELGNSLQINFLHCNAHFLLGVSSTFEKTLLSFERKLIARADEYLGRDKDRAFSFFSKESESATNRLIRCTCNLLGPSGDQKNGCRPQWVTFCSEAHNVVPIPSFKSNRFNCFFQAAVAIMYHHDKLVTFFTSGILHDNPNMLIKSVTLDLQDIKLMSLICCVALFCLKVTTPYWLLVKSDAVQYTEFFTYVQMMYDCFQRWSTDPSELLDVSFTSVFGDAFTYSVSPAFDVVHRHLERFDSVLVADLLRAICIDVCSLTERQLKDFLDDGYYSHVSDEMKSTLRHCPLTNLVGESAFGDFDYDVMKRRNASLHNRSAIHAVKRNGTMKFLSESKSAQEQKVMFEVARKHGKEMRKESRALEVKVGNDMREKFVANQQIKIDKQVKGMELKSKVERDVELHGGPCRRSEDVDRLYERLKEDGCSVTKIKDVLKNEIRFHKFMSGNRSLKFGDVDFMLNVLRSFFKSDSDSGSELPSSSKKRKV